LTPARARGLAQPALAGLVAAVVGFAGSFSVVLAGLRGVGADERQAASGLFALCLAMGLAGIWLSWRRRMPLSIAWSMPGAALLATTGPPPGGWPAAVGAFAVAGALLALAGAWGRLARWVAAIPGSLANAMLAGVLLPICLAPARAVAELPLLAAPVVVAWIVLLRVARRWAILGALVVAAAAIVLDRPDRVAAIPLALPALAWTTPHFGLAAIASVAVPLFLVTMASQNVTGMGVLASFGYRPALRPVLATTGAATVLSAPFGGHAINLAAITAALMAGPDAHADPRRRWVAGVAGGATYVLIAFAAAVVTAFLAVAPALLVEAVAGLALVGALAGALSAAMAGAEQREAALVTLLVSASGVTALGISAPFLGLLAGLVVLAVLRPRR
jgi:benzoate transporter